MEELDIGLTSLDDYGAEHYGLGKEALFAMRKMEQTQKQMEKRFNDRCRKMEETQCRILKALKELSDGSSKEKSIVSASSNALRELFTSLLRYVETILAFPEKIAARMADFFNGLTKLLSRGNIHLLTKFHALHAILRTHWQASLHPDSTMTAAYPWLSFAMASCYYLALSAWLVESVSSLYQWCTMDFGYHCTVFQLVLGVIFVCLHRAVPYTLGSGNPFTTMVLLLLWTVLYVMTGA